MSRLRETWRRVVGSLSGHRQDADLAAELDAHLAMQIEEYVRRGMNPVEARRLAHGRLGAIEAGKEAYRDQRGWPLLDALLRDVRHTGRLVTKQPAFYLSVVLVLAGTIALCVVMFSAVHAILLRPLPYADPERLVRVRETNPAGQAFAVSLANYVSWRDETTTFAQLALFQPRTFELGGDRQQPERVQGVLASANFFDLLQTRPLLGRSFRPGEDIVGQPRIALLSHGLWLRRFGGRPDILGQAIRVGGHPHTVIGILAPTFEFPNAPSGLAGGPVELITPSYATPDQFAQRGDHSWQVLGRLRDGVSLTQARDEMTRTAARLASAYETNRRWGADVIPLRESVFGTTTRVLWLLLAGVGALLLLGCANVANLLLARGVSRRRELALRAAIGGSRRRLLAQMFTESVTLAIAAALLGLALAHAGLRLLIALAPRDLPRIDQVSIDGVVLTVTIALAVATGILVGLLPAWQAGRSEPGELLAGGRGIVSRAGLRAQASLIVGQIAITVVLLVAAGLLLRTALAMQRTEIGFDPSHRLTFRLSVDEERYPGEGGQWRFVERAIARVQALPGVDAAAAASKPPMVWGDSLLAFSIAGRPAPEPGQSPTALYYSISPDYFRTLGIPLRDGRPFGTQDTSASPSAVIVNEYLVKKHLAGVNPIGARLSIFRAGPSVIVGVVGDTKHYGFDSPTQEQVYFPYAQFASAQVTMLVDTRMGMDAMMPAIRHALGEIDPEQPISNVLPMDEAVASKMAQQRLSAALLSAFAALALLLAGAGTFAVFSYAVSRRTPEIGLRLALGAQRRQVLGLVIGGSLRLTVVGVLIGLAAAWPVAHWLGALLFGVEPMDPMTVGLVIALVLGSAALACAGPARRALGVDPTVALRAD